MSDLVHVLKLICSNRKQAVSSSFGVSNTQFHHPDPLQESLSTKIFFKKMKQTIVMKISMKGPKCRTKALKIAVGVPGVEKAEFQGDDKCQIAVTGNEIDSIELTKLIRKKVGPTELVTVKEEKKEEKKEEVQAIVWQPSVYGVPGFYYPEAPRANDICTIL